MLCKWSIRLTIRVLSILFRPLSLAFRLFGGRSAIFSSVLALTMLRWERSFLSSLLILIAFAFLFPSFFSRFLFKLFLPNLSFLHLSIPVFFLPCFFIFYRRIADNQLVFTLCILSFSIRFWQEFSFLFLLIWKFWFGVQNTAGPIFMKQLGNRLGKIYLNPTVVDHDIVHLQVGLLAGRNVLKLDESVLKTRTCLPVTNNLHALYRSESRKYYLKISLLSYWVELAYKKDIFRRLKTSIRQIA